MLATARMSAMERGSLPGEHRIANATVGYKGHTGFGWSSKGDPKFIHPHERKPAQAFEPHISSYNGHQPMNWDPHRRNRPKSLPAVQTRILPRAARTASDDFGMWYGFIGQFPSSVDGWKPASRPSTGGAGAL
eukprot:TRINITY_DN47030_c0_g1_i1.p1 TRINITY_DN47030_c0_g1~~TRINITY_DN47030_c0_g1_i1.p1  ORF type:complete len:133 (-),score=12.76 TRINITY_DN47030_c0_g1_i1:110-508(-)